MSTLQPVCDRSSVKCEEPKRVNPGQISQIGKPLRSSDALASLRCNGCGTAAGSCCLGRVTAVLLVGLCLKTRTQLKDDKLAKIHVITEARCIEYRKYPYL